jgi:hypothetical protein
MQGIRLSLVVFKILLEDEDGKIGADYRLEAG